MIKALDQLDPSRKCFRLVGEVLVERTVEEVLPAVKGNAEQIDMVSCSSKYLPCLLCNWPVMHGLANCDWPVLIATLKCESLLIFCLRVEQSCISN